MKRLVILLVFFLLSTQLKAQWQQLQDPILHNNRINCMVYVKGYLFAATNAGLYYSPKDNVHWSRRSLNSYLINQVNCIGNTLFVVFNNYIYNQNHPRILGQMIWALPGTRSLLRISKAILSVLSWNDWEIPLS